MASSDQEAAQRRRRGLAGLDKPAPLPVAKSKNTITDVAARCVQEPVSKRAYVIVTIRTDGGVTGIGETAVRPDPKTAVARILAQRRNLVGRDATAAELVRRSLSAQMKERHGELAPVQAAVNSALLDILGKLAKAPVYEILGGPTRNKIRALACLEGTADKDLQAAVNGARQAGYRAFSVPLRTEGAARARSYFQQTLHVLDGLRSKAGADMDFVLDCGGRLTAAQAQGLARTLERFHLLWLDEPMGNADRMSLARISAETVTPLGIGRTITENRDFLDLLRSDAVDALRPDIALNGITSIRKAAALAETYYVAVAPFHRGGPIATAAALHLAASIPNFFIQEIPFPTAERDRAMRRELVGRDLETAQDGFLALPRGPGLGIHVNEGAVKRYQVK